jgi:hypothetical protein
MLILGLGAAGAAAIRAVASKAAVIRIIDMGLS